MLRTLHIRNYILIDSLEVEFPEGLVIITGQTGAGKSILLGAIGLLSGGKGDGTLVSDGAENCVVEAEFDNVPEAVRPLLEEADAEWDDGHLIIRRVLSRSGRSRSFVNDCPVNVTLLQDISSHLVDIHSQHRSLLLTDRAFQLSVLDFFAGNQPLLEECRRIWDELVSVRTSLGEASRALERLSADQSWNQSQWEQLDSARLIPGELESLEEEQRTLSNAEQIKEALGSACALMDADEGSGRPSIDATLKEARRQLEHASRFVPAATELASRLESARIEIADILSETGAVDSRILLSQERLEAVDARLSLLYSLMKKHSCSSIEELIDIRERFNDSLYDTTALADRIAGLEKRRAELSESYSALCARLHESRLAAAAPFADDIMSSLHFLELERAAFCVKLSDGRESASGTDAVEFQFASDGVHLQDVAKCASGGEISRIMLCLKAMMARFVGMPTLVFDEIDTGVSGSVADKMGEMICGMGHDMQVFSITHLPQVAAKGSAHYVVSKNTDASGRMVSSMREVSGKERVMEIARLLSGSVITDAAVANAESLLEQQH